MLTVETNCTVTDSAMFPSVRVCMNSNVSRGDRKFWSKGQRNAIHRRKFAVESNATKFDLRAIRFESFQNPDLVSSSAELYKLRTVSMEQSASPFARHRSRLREIWCRILIEWTNEWILSICFLFFFILLNIRPCNIRFDCLSHIEIIFSCSGSNKNSIIIITIILDHRPFEWRIRIVCWR